MSFDKDIKPCIKKRLGTFACLFSQSILNETLKDLSEKFILNQLVIEDTLFYSFAIPLMREWIQETRDDPLPIISHNSIHLLQRLPLLQFSQLDNQLKKQIPGIYLYRLPLIINVYRIVVVRGGSGGS